jgi:hypothetical protein
MLVQSFIRIALMVKKLLTGNESVTDGQAETSIPTLHFVTGGGGIMTLTFPQCEEGCGGWRGWMVNEWIVNGY